MMKKFADAVCGILAKTGMGKIPGISKIYKKIYSIFFFRGFDKKRVADFFIFSPQNKTSFKLKISDGKIYETDAINFLKDVIKTGMTFFDVGAHVGYYSFPVSKLVGENGRVFSFEPAKENFECLIKGINENSFKNIMAMKTAVGENNEEGKLFLNFGNTTLHSLVEGNIRHEGEKENVNIISLDSFAKEKMIEKVDIIKSDTQGFDTKVMRGAEGIIKSNPDIKILMEFWPIGIKKAGDNPEEFWRWMKNLGLIPYHFEKGAPYKTNYNEVLEICVDRRGDFGNINIFWTRSPLQ